MSIRPQSWGARAVLLLPYLWLAAFFLAPFVIVFKISLSQTAVAQPPYLPVLDLAAGWAGLQDFVARLTADGYRLLGVRPDLSACRTSRACSSPPCRPRSCSSSAIRSPTAWRAHRAACSRSW